MASRRVTSRLDRRTRVLLSLLAAVAAMTVFLAVRVPAVELVAVACFTSAALVLSVAGYLLVPPLRLRRTGPRPEDVTVVFNPSKTLDPEGRRKEILAAFTRSGVEHVRWLETTVDDPGTLVCRGAVDEGTDLVVACGGDGTVAACATAVAGTGIPLAVLPSGTGNLLALNFKLPSDLDTAVAVALHGERRFVDVGWCDEKAFVVMAGVGFDAEMVRDASPALKRRAGWLAYVVSAFRHLPGRSSTFTVSVDGSEPVRVRGRAAIVANVGTIQGGMELFPDASPTDGLLDVSVLSPRGVGWVTLAAHVLVRRAQRAPQVSSFRGAVVDVTSSRKLPFELDGDDFQPVDSLRFECRPGALLLCTPQ